MNYSGRITHIIAENSQGAEVILQVESFEISDRGIHFLTYPWAGAPVTLSHVKEFRALEEGMEVLVENVNHQFVKHLEEGDRVDTLISLKFFNEMRNKNDTE